MNLDIGHFTRLRFIEGGWTLDVGRWTHFTIGALLSLFISCQSKSTEQPSLPDEKIARIMADLSIADAATTGLSGYRKDSLMHAYFEQVFEMHSVTLESYEKDLRILAQDLPRMENIVKQADALLMEGGKGEGSAPKN